MSADAEIRLSFDLDEEEMSGNLLAHLKGQQVGRLEIRPGGHQDGHDAWLLPHTETDASVEGKGVGSMLARTVLDEARSRGLMVRPLCPFVKGWIDRHPEYADLVLR